MANNFAGEKFASREVCENRLSQFFANRDEGFYERGIIEYLQNGIDVNLALNFIKNKN